MAIYFLCILFGLFLGRVFQAKQLPRWKRIVYTVIILTVCNMFCFWMLAGKR